MTLCHHSSHYLSVSALFELHSRERTSRSCVLSILLLVSKVGGEGTQPCADQGRPTKLRARVAAPGVHDGRAILPCARSAKPQNLG